MILVKESIMETLAPGLLLLIDVTRSSWILRLVEILPAKQGAIR